MNNEQEKQELKKLVDKWKDKHKRMDKENIKRTISLMVTGAIDFVVIGLQLLNIIPFEVTLIAITSMFIIGMIINYFVHQRIQKIILE